MTHPRAGRPRERVLTMRGIGKRFGAVRALTDVDFWVNEGEVVALVGDNGAGKSTLVKVLAGVHPPDAGTIEFDGELGDRLTRRCAASWGSRRSSRTSRCATTSTSSPTCGSAASFVDGATLDEVDMEQRTWTLLRELSAKIPSVRVPVASLSGGQRQTVAIARSLIGEPRVVILDEPTAALGVAQTAEVLNLIERLRERGHGVILISHNMADVLAVADRVVVLAPRPQQRRVQRRRRHERDAHRRHHRRRRQRRRAARRTARRTQTDADVRADPRDAEPSADEGAAAPVIRMPHAGAPSARPPQGRAPMSRAARRASDGAAVRRAASEHARGIASGLAGFVTRIRGGDLGVAARRPGHRGDLDGVPAAQPRVPLQREPRQPHDAVRRRSARSRSASCSVLLRRRDRPLGRLGVGPRRGGARRRPSCSCSGTLISGPRGRGGRRMPRGAAVRLSCSPASGCRASSSRSRACSASSGCSCGCWARRDRSPSRSTRGSSQFAQQMFLPAWAVVRRGGAGGRRPSRWSLLRRARRRAGRESGEPELHRDRACAAALLLAFLARGHVVPEPLSRRRRDVPVLPGPRRRRELRRSPAPAGVAPVYAVGGSVEAATACRHPGATGIYLSVFAMCSTLAAVGGILGGRAPGVGEPELGDGRRRTSTRSPPPSSAARASFGGRGSAFSALVGIVVIQSISSGLTLHEPRLVRAVHGHRRGAGARGDRRLALAAHPRRHRPRLTPPRRAGFTWRTLGAVAPQHSPASRRALCPFDQREPGHFCTVSALRRAPPAASSAAPARALPKRYVQDLTPRTPVVDDRISANETRDDPGARSLQRRKGE